MFDDPETEDAFARFEYAQSQRKKTGIWWIFLVLLMILGIGFFAGTVVIREHHHRCDCEEQKR